MVDRASKFTVLHPVSSRSAGEVGEAMMERLMPYVEIVHTITSDNGKEFTGHGEITEALGAGFFFATLILRVVVAFFYFSVLQEFKFVKN